MRKTQLQKTLTVLVCVALSGRYRWKVSFLGCQAVSLPEKMHLAIRGHFHRRAVSQEARSLQRTTEGIRDELMLHMLSRRLDV